MKTIIIGLPYFVKKLVRNLSEYDKGNTYIGLDISRGIFNKIKYMFHLITADTIYSIGGFIVYSKAAAMALFFKKRFVMHWVGSDVLNAERAYRQGLASKLIIDRVNHLSEAVWIQEELKHIGITTQIMHYEGFSMSDAQINALPSTFSVLSYVAENREEFYGMEKLVRLAGDFPDVEIKIAGISASKKELPPNVRLLGWTDKMDEHYKDCVLFLRLVEHDGLSFSVREALANGRYVGYSYEYDNVFYIDNYSKLRDVASDLYEKHRGNSLPINYQGISFIRKNFDKHVIFDKLIKTLKEGI